jgi:hypothetical protein
MEIKLRALQMLKYQLYDSRLSKHLLRDVTSTTRRSGKPDDNDSALIGADSAIRRQISKHPAIALNVGIATGFLLGWLVKR